MDIEGVSFPRSDAIIIMANKEGVEVRCLLVHNGSSCDILFLEAFMKMGIKMSSLKPYSMGLIGFTGHESPIIEMTTLPLTFGKWPITTTETVDCLVTDLLSAYNGIINKPS